MTGDAGDAGAGIQFAIRLAVLLIPVRAERGNQLRPAPAEWQVLVAATLVPEVQLAAAVAAAVAAVAAAVPAVSLSERRQHRILQPGRHLLPDP